MASVTLKNIKKIYPNTSEGKKGRKKKKKEEHVSDEPKANLQITEQGVVAVQQFSLDIADKEFIVLVGPSGCGKSTTLRMIAGLEEITEGELYIGDKLMNDVAPKDRDIAMVFQNYALYPHMTVYENIGTDAAPGLQYSVWEPPLHPPGYADRGRSSAGRAWVCKLVSSLLTGAGPAFS